MVLSARAALDSISGTIAGCSAQSFTYNIAGSTWPCFYLSQASDQSTLLLIVFYAWSTYTEIFAKIHIVMFGNLVSC